MSNLSEIKNLCMNMALIEESYDDMTNEAITAFVQCVKILGSKVKERRYSETKKREAKS